MDGTEDRGGTAVSEEEGGEEEAVVAFVPKDCDEICFAGGGGSFNVERRS